MLIEQRHGRVMAAELDFETSTQSTCQTILQQETYVAMLAFEPFC